jgi:hypothetical protein
MRTCSVVVAILAAAACSSKKAADDHAAGGSGSGSASASGSAAPTPTPAPPDAAGVEVNGVRVTSGSDHAVVVDTVGGYAIDLPGAAKAEADTEGLPGVGVTVETDDAMLRFRIKRLPPGVRGVPVGEQYQRMVDDLAKKSWDFKVQEPMQLAGKPGFHYVANKEMNGIPLRMEAWILEVPSATTLYQLLMSTEAGKDAPGAWPMTIGTLREGQL